MSLACPTPSLAHVKWFEPYEISTKPVPMGDALSQPAFWIAAALVLALFLATIIAERTSLGRAVTTRLDRLTAPLRARADQFIVCIMGGFFVALFATARTILTPELLTDARWVGWLQLLIAMCLFSRRLYPIAAAGIIGLWLYALVDYDLFHMLDYVTLGFPGARRNAECCVIRSARFAVAMPEEPMGLFFANDLHDEFGTWPLAYIRYGGLDVGEILAVAKRVGDGDDSAFHAAWTAMGDALAAEAEAALAKRRPITAREFFLKAACAYDASYHPLFGEPVDPRLLTAFSKQIDTLQQGPCAVRPADRTAAHSVRGHVTARLFHPRHRPRQSGSSPADPHQWL